jgi:hypothetical protein
LLPPFLYAIPSEVGGMQAHPLSALTYRFLAKTSSAISP